MRRLRGVSVRRMGTWRVFDGRVCVEGGLCWVGKVCVFGGGGGVNGLVMWWLRSVLRSVG